MRTNTRARRRGWHPGRPGRNALGLVAWTALAALAWNYPSGIAAQEPGGYTNLHVLPQDISRPDLSRIMLDNLAGLGLPRRANEGCLFCHAGSMDVPAGEWDWASDDNPMKVKARSMMAMVDEINDTWLAGLDRPSSVGVGCYTCHAARTNPMPLTEVLAREYAEGGVEALVQSYRTLRTRYFAADAYDFRTATLEAVAQTIAERGAIADAVRVHELNIEYSDAPAAHQGLIQLRMIEALGVGGATAMISRYHELKAEHPTEAYTPMLIDPLAWYLFRGGQRSAGFSLFELNFDEHPDAYVATEDLAWGNQSMGNHERAVALAEAWLVRHPGHELGTRLLNDLRNEGGR